MAEPLAIAEHEEAIIRCKVTARRHQHGQGCWGMPSALTHHELVYTEGQDFTCSCGVWGSAEPGYLGYQWHLRTVIERQAARVHEVAGRWAQEAAACRRLMDDRRTEPEAVDMWRYRAEAIEELLADHQEARS